MGKTLQIFGFPSNVTAKEVKDFLEKYTGQGSIYAIKIRQSKVESAGAFAIVQFTTIENTKAKHIFAKRLRYKNSKLRAQTMVNDIVSKSMVTMFNLENVGLHFGCQVSDERFSVLWKCYNVEVSFGFGLQKLFFYLSHCDVKYKLELSSQNIWRIKLHHPRGQLRKFLLIQLFGAPRIYEKILQSPEPTIHEDSVLNYYKDIPDDQWVRITDFTPSCSIAQSSCICLQLPHNCPLPNIRELFFYYEKNEDRFALENGSSFCRNLDLVPIVQPPDGIKVPFDILYKVSSLVQQGCIPGPTLDRQFFSLVDPESTARAHIERALHDLYRGEECCYEPVKWLRNQYKRYQTSKNVPKTPRISLSSGVVYLRRVQVTPCKVYFYGPEPIVSNRVLRHYPEEIDNFIRVAFVDEELDKIFPMDLYSSRKSSASDDDKYTGIYKRLLSVLKNGIVIGDKKFEFLAFSPSQLRENSVWMFASTNELTADSIREWMGDFRNIRNVAKFAARLGQSFSSSIGTLNVNSGEFEVIPDVEIEGENGTTYVFSDGIGKISVEFARRVAAACNLRGCTPSAFQIRYAGYKGVVALDPTSTAKLSLRPSMAKYDSETTKLDVLTWSKFHPCYLNRQIIVLLSTLGVEDQIFENKQKEIVEQLDLILTDPFVAREVLDIMSVGESTRVLKEMLKCYKPDADPYLSRMLRTFRLSKFLDLRTRSRIFVPHGRAMMGCLDETGTLDYGEVFIQVSSVGYRQFNDSSIFTFGGIELSQQTCIVTGTVVVAKNPCLHPGDVRVLCAVDVPALHHMVDCLVFPKKGERPHPNECSGSDLDGDVYFVSWDPLLIPPRQVQPMHYTSAPNIQLDHEVTIEEVEEYFANYMVNDCLGVMANTHTVFADKRELKAESDECLELAKLFSIAVDFNKTGIPARIPSRLHVKEYPDFMEKPNRDTYESQSVIGKLYREIKDVAPKTFSLEPFTREMASKYYDRDLEVDGYRDYIDDAYECKAEYDYKLGGLMEKYGIKTEAELVSGNIINESKSFQKLKDPEEIGLAVRSLKKEARGWFTGKSTNSDSQEAKASAWYHVTYHPDFWGCYNEGKNWDHFLSFPWCVCDELLRIKKKKMTAPPTSAPPRRRRRRSRHAQRKQ
uniref:RNA-dependent RNA polymerase n=1 Tax=Nelumbo nucifera TaxID=4432 RepID=A0A822YI49_NELNU|nr:TPA_asm: hypothetical protein HUJ06_011101 [Nelumbo nucifera]